MSWLLWVTLGLCVCGAKYYTAVGGRRLERRLNRVKTDLEHAKGSLRERREKQSAISIEEEVAELRLRYTKELIEDLKARLAQREEPTKIKDDDGPTILPAMARF